MSLCSKPKILIIDDSRLSVVMLSDGLRKHGFKVLDAGDGEDGLQIVQKEFPDLIVLDMYLPTMTGHEVLERMQDFPSGQSVPVIIMTASESLDDIPKHQNVRACFSKSVPISQLIAKIHECLNFSSD